MRDKATPAVERGKTSAPKPGAIGFLQMIEVSDTQSHAVFPTWPDACPSLAGYRKFGCFSGMLREGQHARDRDILWLCAMCLVIFQTKSPSASAGFLQLSAAPTARLDTT